MPESFSIGIMRDAETNRTGAFQSVCSAIRGAGLAEPPQVLTVAAGPPQVGVFILPDCANDGMLEDLCLQAVASDTAVPCVDECFACLQRQAIRPSHHGESTVASLSGFS